MTNRRENHEDFLHATTVHERGIPVDEYELERMKTASLGLSIEQGGYFPTEAFNLRSGQAGYSFSVLISNDSQRPLDPVHIGFDIPWDRSLSLLPDPRKEHPGRQQFRRGRHKRDDLKLAVLRNTYSFRDTGQSEWERDAVINHQLGRSRPVFPNESVEGLLLAVGLQRIPSEYHDGDRAEVHLMVFDQRGHYDRKPFLLHVLTSIRPRAYQEDRPVRRPIFETADVVDR
jgi:hypothetical protein